MVLPNRISELLTKHEVAELHDHECEGSKFHSPRPLRIHGYRLEDHRLVYLCGTCRDNLNVYLMLHELENGLDWPTKREFGNNLRRVADRVLMAKRAVHD